MISFQMKKIIKQLNTPSFKIQLNFTFKLFYDSIAVANIALEV